MTLATGLRSAALAAFAVGCAGGYAGEPGSDREQVSGGTVSGEADDAVVRLISRQPSPYDAFGCTGALLAPNVLLTGLHCASVFDGPQRFGCRPDGSLDPRWSGGWIGVPLDPGSIEVYFGAQNVFDKEYYVGTNPTTTGSPRLMNVGVRLRFNGQ